MAIASDLLLQIACMRKLSAPTVMRTAHHSTLIISPAGETYFQQGGAPSGLYMLLEGRAKLYRQSRERMQILALPSAGQCYGAETIPTDMPSLCSASALTPTRALYIAPDLLRTILADCPDFQELLLELVTTRLKQFVSLVHDLAFRDVTARLAAVLVQEAAEEGALTPDGIRIHRLLSQQEFAAFVGTAREVIYRTFRKLEQDKILHLTTDEIFILDLDRLDALAHQEVR